MKHGPLIYKHCLLLLERFHQQCFQKELQITWEDRQTNVGVLEAAKVTSVEAMILCWTSHVVRMPDYHLPKQLLYSQFKKGK